MIKKSDSPAEQVIAEIKSFVRNSPANRMSGARNDFIFDEPLVQFADGDDPIFTEYKKIIRETHQTPREALAAISKKPSEELPKRLTIISWILPITEKTRVANRAETKVPARTWSHTRWFGEIFNEALRKHMVDYLNDKGYLTAAPGIPPYVKMANDNKGLYSNWSERHIAYAAGLGTFSLNDGFITERGIAHRCGSVVTTLQLPASPRTYKDHYANCLFYAAGKCDACIKRCPADAISEKGHDKVKCGKISPGHRL